MTDLRVNAKAWTLTLAAAGFIALTSATSAAAGDGHFHGYVDDARFHDELEHRAFHRELAHREAHRYPLTWRQHERLHDALDHEAFHDHLADRDYHRYQRPNYVLRSPYGLPGHSAYHGYYGSYGRSPGYTLPRRRVIYSFSN
jgi:hypothetical protein